MITTPVWTDIMYMANDGTSTGASINYVVYIIMVVIGSLFMLNLVIGVLCGEFSKERELVEHRNSYLKMRDEKEINTAMQGYLEWMHEGERVTYEEERASRKKIPDSRVSKPVNLTDMG